MSREGLMVEKGIMGRTAERLNLEEEIRGTSLGGLKADIFADVVGGSREDH
jgi:hypothetical protein